MTQFEKRLAAAEARAGTGGSIGYRFYIPPTGCPDLPAWEQACKAEAARDRVHPLIVRFVKPGDVMPPDGPTH